MPIGMTPVDEEVKNLVIVPSDEEGETGRAAGPTGSPTSEITDTESSTASNVEMDVRDGDGGVTDPALASRAVRDGDGGVADSAVASRTTGEAMPFYQ